MGKTIIDRLQLESWKLVQVVVVRQRVKTFNVEVLCVHVPPYVCLVSNPEELTEGNLDDSLLWSAFIPVFLKSKVCENVLTLIKATSLGTCQYFPQRDGRLAFIFYKQSSLHT